MLQSYRITLFSHRTHLQIFALSGFVATAVFVHGVVRVDIIDTTGNVHLIVLTVVKIKSYTKLFLITGNEFSCAKS